VSGKPIQCQQMRCWKIATRHRGDEHWCELHDRPPVSALVLCTDPACPVAWAYRDPPVDHWHPRPHGPHLEQVPPATARGTVPAMSNDPTPQTPDPNAPQPQPDQPDQPQQPDVQVNVEQPDSQQTEDDA
jgi:hypothetical protein